MIEDFHLESIVFAVGNQTGAVLISEYGMLHGPAFSQFHVALQLQPFDFLPKMKFAVQITDLTGSIQAMAFTEVANQYYGIKAQDIDKDTMDGSLPLPLLQKLSQPRDCSFYLKAYMNDYGGISECKFIVQSIFDIKATTEEPNSSKHLLMLAPETPNKKSKTDKRIAEGSTINSANKSLESSTKMEAEGDNAEDDTPSTNKSPELSTEIEAEVDTPIKHTKD